MNLPPKKVIITGATSGIGRFIALKLASSGTVLSVCGRSKEKMDELLLLADNSKEIHWGLFDVTDENEITAFVSDAVDYMGGCDVLINCAGVNSARGNVLEMKTSDLDYMMKVNVNAPFVFMREAGKYMKESGSGLIINILSTVCLFSNEGIGAYTASKSAFDALTGVFRKEVRNYNIRVSSVYPGGVNTPFRNTERHDYLSSESVADAVISLLTFDDKAFIDEIVLRPQVETNFA
ncbi:MAG: SDR family oxidoreductase [Spirochaetes bacterium]|nr:SDR family oxidoreductase [Spirochaetota bacterium]